MTPQNSLIWSSISLFICPPLGIPSFIFSFFAVKTGDKTQEAAKETAGYVQTAQKLNIAAIVGGLLLWFGVYQYCSYYSIENKAKRNAEELKLTMKNAFGDAEGFPGAMFNGIKPPEPPKILTEKEIDNKVQEIFAKDQDVFEKLGNKSNRLDEENGKLGEQYRKLDYKSDEYKKIEEKMDKNLEELKKINSEMAEISKKRKQEVMEFYEQQGKVQPVQIPDWLKNAL
jgi:hypothetical protein